MNKIHLFLNNILRREHTQLVFQAIEKICCLMEIAIQGLKSTLIIWLRAHWLHRKLGRLILERLEPQRGGLQLFSPNNKQLLMFQDLDNILFLDSFRKRKKRCAHKVQEAFSKILNFRIHFLINLKDQFLTYLLLACMKKLEI